jgi:hypothetical protein
MTETRDPFLARWSRRKQAKLDESDAGGDAQAVAGSDGEVIGQESGENPATAEIVEQLPDIESLDENSDFTAFLKEGVPDALRRGALRRLWRLNPVFANLDGLADYDEDFTTPTGLAGQVKTLYQVGKGMPGATEPEPEQEAPADAEIAEDGTGQSEESVAHGSEQPEPEVGPQDPESAGAEAVNLPEDAANLRGSGIVVEQARSDALTIGSKTRESDRTTVKSAVERRWGKFHG